MSIDKQYLREVAKQATGAHERINAISADDIFDISLHHDGAQLDADITDLNSFNEAANPATVLALLDELEAAEMRIAELEARTVTLLAAENAALNKFIKDDCWIWDDKSEEYFDAADCMPETPATDAFLAEVRAHGVKSLSNAVQSVISERQRQQSVEGWTPKHDDKHDNNELAFAASCYAFHSAAASWDFEDDGTPYDIHPAPKNWPWSPEWWKPKNPRRDLVKAGALILAEIERLDRAAAGKGE